ncbi:DDE superfamily endonuclease [Phytophthora infestans]|uniref:DDE superfamily endonuclease n=1 Tax=Phytophthora infestans TaxID=4787 RepID=A0A8S9UQH8_PHYIN|nr:DDE superfamily endonuclease [Phytophthora infestans]KAF4143051.1 DDE superfamily endonuclease [Phytophthora infestans]
MIVCDEKKRIIYALVEWPESCADSAVFSKSRLATDPSAYSSYGQYLLGDSRYQPTERMLVPYKKPKATLLHNATLSTILASARAVNENCIGLLRNRWAFLK